MDNINKCQSRKIQFNYGNRGFFCPTCLHGVENKSHDCKNCGQKLVEAYEFAKKSDE